MLRMRIRTHITAAIAALLTLTSASIATAQDPIRIGEVNSYTGPLASFTVVPSAEGAGFVFQLDF